MASQERETLSFLVQQHRAQIAVADTDLTLIRDGTGDAERLQAAANAAGRVGGGLYAFLERDGRAQFIRPLDVFKADGLSALDDLVSIHAASIVESLDFLEILEAIFVQHRLKLGNTSFVILKQGH